MPRPLKRGILGASTIILSKDIDKYAFMCGSNFYETDVTRLKPKCTAGKIRQINKFLDLFSISVHPRHPQGYINSLVKEIVGRSSSVTMEKHIDKSQNLNILVFAQRKFGRKLEFR